jgi:hypothetical protein
MFVLIAQRDQRSKMIGSLLIGWQKREEIYVFQMKSIDIFLKVFFIKRVG